MILNAGLIFIGIALNAWGILNDAALGASWFWPGFLLNNATIVMNAVAIGIDLGATP